MSLSPVEVVVEVAVVVVVVVVEVIDVVVVDVVVVDVVVVLRVDPNPKGPKASLPTPRMLPYLCTGCRRAEEEASGRQESAVQGSGQTLLNS